MRLTTLSLIAAFAASPAFAHGDEDHDYGALGKQVAAAEKSGDHGTMNHGKMDHSTMDHGKMDHSEMEGVHTSAKINSIEGDTWNVTHPPIPELRWPTMTMDLQLLDGAEVGDIAAGDEAMLMLEQGADGMYGIRAAMPK